MDPLADLRSSPFLPAWAYGSAQLAGAERQRYAIQAAPVLYASQEPAPVRPIGSTATS